MKATYKEKFFSQTNKSDGKKKVTLYSRLGNTCAHVNMDQIRLDKKEGEE